MFRLNSFSGSNFIWSFLRTTFRSGQIAFTTPGTYTWTAPAGITKVCVVAIGGGGAGSVNRGATSRMPGGSGGGLGWKNDIPVIPGQTYTVVVGAGQPSFGATGDVYAGSQGTGKGEDSYFIDITTVAGLAGRGANDNTNPVAGGGYVGDGGGNGGATATLTTNGSTSGGSGAGGYSGAGGIGGTALQNLGNGVGYGTNGSGGGGGGGGSHNDTSGGTMSGGAGGGTGILGEGSSGAGGAYTSGSSGAAANGGPGGGGSGGSDGTSNDPGVSTPNFGGSYGGGGQAGSGGSGTLYGGSGGGGAVRIIWGPGRAFPSTKTTDL